MRGFRLGRLALSISLYKPNNNVKRGPVEKIGQMKDVDEYKIYADIRAIVQEEVANIRKKPSRDEDDFKSLFLLARTYAILKDDFRADMKEDTFGKLGIRD
jgi:hypothetical protein